MLSEKEVFDLAFYLYWFVAITTFLSAFQIMGFQPLREYKEAGGINTPLKKIGFYSIRVVYNTLGFIGGVMLANNVVGVLALMISSITISFVLMSGLIIGIVVSVLEHYKYLSNK